jgi:hypothetical protein
MMDSAPDPRGEYVPCPTCGKIFNFMCPDVWHLPPTYHNSTTCECGSCRIKRSQMSAPLRSGS